MRCAGVKPLLDEYLEGALAYGERRAVEAHLRSCARCRDELEFLKRYRARAASLKPVRAPRDFTTRLMKRLEREERDTGPLIAPWKLRLSLGAAGLLAAAVVVVMLVPGYRAREIGDEPRTEESRSLPPARLSPPRPDAYMADDRFAAPAERQAKSHAPLRRQTGADALPSYDIALTVSPWVPRLEGELDSARDRGRAVDRIGTADEAANLAQMEEGRETVSEKKSKVREDKSEARVAEKDARAMKEQKQALKQTDAVKEIIASYGGTVTKEESNLVQSKVPARNLAPLVKKLGAIGTVQKSRMGPPAKTGDVLLNITITEKK